MDRPNIPDAPPELRGLLERLPETTGGLWVTQHAWSPTPGEWFAGWNSGGDLGPYESAEAALAGAVAWLYRRWQETIEERDAAWDRERANLPPLMDRVNAAAEQAERERERDAESSTPRAGVVRS